jgi:hypothetical protein
VTVMTPVFCMFLKRICGDFSFVPLRAVLYVLREKRFEQVLKRNEVLLILNRPWTRPCTNACVLYGCRILRARTDEASEKNNPRFTLKRFSRASHSCDHTCGFFKSTTD